MKSSEIIQRINLIYSEYCIPLNLQRHMLLVGAVAEQLCDNAQEEVDKDNVVAAALAHDLGNIVKMDFEHEKTICMLDDEDKAKLGFYKTMKRVFVKKYGCNDAMVNCKIIKELGANKRINYFFENKELEHVMHEDWKKDLGLMIFAYSDLRVTPYGVVSLKERVADFAKRHCKPGDKKCLQASKNFFKFAKSMEAVLFNKLKIKPSQINTKSTRAYLENYQKNY